MYRSFLIDNLFDGFFNDVPASTNYRTYTEDDVYRLDVLVPNFEKKEIDINIENDTLMIKSNVPEDNEDKWKRVFNLKFRIPREGDAENISAVMDKGLLKVTIPKMATAKPKMIAIK